MAEAQRLANIGSWSYDFKRDCLTWSDQLYSVFGTDKKTFLETHKSFIHLVDEEDRNFVEQTSRYTQQTGEPFKIEYRITTSSGEKRVIEEHGYGQRDVEGAICKLFGTAQDITERKKTAQIIEKVKLNTAL
jgi:PAS domain S-box-containing protein